MKKPLFVATFVALFGILLASNASAQQVPGRPPVGAPPAAPAAAPVASVGIAVLDLKQVFDSHVRFKAMRDELMRDVKVEEEQMKQRHDALRKMAEKLKDYNPGTQEYKQLEAQVANEQADLKVATNIKMKDFTEREAKIHYHIYQEVLDEIKYFAEQHRIVCVLRFSGDKVDPNNPQSILSELNKSVVHYDSRIDITQQIIAAINARYEQRPQAPTATQRNAPQGVPRRPQ
ncbi:MAG: OmpH family outer membrane protein [Pirellulales bacterium]|nr:OmpH family outer membrane protein [Pirellulales bacterium]